MLHGIVEFGFAHGVEELVGEIGALAADRQDRIDGEKSLYQLDGGENEGMMG